MTRNSHRRFVTYIDTTRDFYAAQGYETPYAWATGNPVPFTPLDGEPNDATVALVTTATPPEVGVRSLGRFEATPVPTVMATDHLSWHKTATTTDDVGSYLPLEHLRELANAGEVAAAGSHYYTTPTLYSHRRTVANAEKLAGWLREDGVDLVVLAGL